MGFRQSLCEFKASGRDIGTLTGEDKLCDPDEI